MVPEAKRNGRADEESPRRGWLRHPRERDARPDGAWRVTRLGDSSPRFAGLGMTVLVGNAPEGLLSLSFRA